MKILFLTATYKPSINGVAVSVEKFYEELKNRGHEVTVLAPSAWGDKKENNDPKDIIRYPSSPNPLIEDYPIPLVPLSIDELRSKEFDIVHAHHPYHTAFFAEMYADRSRAPFVLTHHTRYSEYSDIYLKNFPRQISTVVGQTSVDDTFAKGNLVIAPSNAIKNELLGKMPYLEVELLPTGISPLPRGTESKSDLRKELGLPEDKTVLISLSRLAKEKNIELLFDSLKLLPEQYYLQIVGGGPHESQLKKYVANEGLSERVKFVGQVQHVEVNKYYEASDIFVMSSTSETQGITLLEAQYCGVPCVVFDCEVNREWVSPDFGFITDVSAKSFANAIVEIKDQLDDENREVVERWAENYTMPKVAERLEKIYEDLIQRKKDSRRLTQQGWQSWSTSRRNYFRFPLWNYPPNRDKTLIPKKRLENRKDRVKGWCSWYAFGREIDHGRIMKQSKYISENQDKYPIDHILIDDGWCMWGDWDKADSVKFPEGLGKTTSSIHSLGLKSGIWVSPFLVDHRSQLARRNPDWIVEQFGRPVNGIKVARLIDDFSPYVKYMLDMKDPEVIEYLHSTINDLVRKNGISLLKLDNLYTLYYHPKIKNAEAAWILNRFLRRIKADNPNLHLMACGSPLVPCVGAVDSMRVGPDPVTPSVWNIPILGRIFNSQKIKMASYKVNSMLWTQKFWNVDADVFVCRAELNLTDRLLRYHREMIINNYLNGGNLFLGDDLTQLQERRYKEFVKDLF